MSSKLVVGRKNRHEMFSEKVPLTRDEQTQRDQEELAWEQERSDREKAELVLRLRAQAEKDYLTEVMSERAKDVDAPQSVKDWDNARK